MKIRFLARRFFCDNAFCTRRIFSEQIEELGRRHAQSTPRFNRELIDIGLEAGGAPGARLARKRGTVASGATILRRLRAMPLRHAVSDSIAIGIDDFAFRRGTRYGTIIIDHVGGRPLDIIDQRESSAVDRWLRGHSTARFVTRDRSGCYGNAVSTALPQAVQVADRWHLLANARAALANLLGRMQPTIRRVAERLASPAPADSPLIATEPATTHCPSPSATPVRMNKEEQLSWDRRLKRVARYERVLELHREGKSQRAIGRMLRMSQKTVSKRLNAGGFIERARRKFVSRITPHVDMLRRWWDEGDHNAKSLHRRLKAVGFDGGSDIVRRFVAPWRTPQERERISGPKIANPKSAQYRPPLPSGNHLSWLLIDDEIERSEIEARLVRSLLEEAPSILIARDAVRAFNDAIRRRDKARLETWKVDSQRAEMPQELKAFAKGVDRDWAEVAAAVEHPYSNGRTEGHVNRLKLIKRKMYGRAKFDLLRIRVLASGP